MKWSREHSDHYQRSSGMWFSHNQMCEHTELSVSNVWSASLHCCHGAFMCAANFPVTKWPLTLTPGCWLQRTVFAFRTVLGQRLLSDLRRDHSRGKCQHLTKECLFVSPCAVAVYGGITSVGVISVAMFNMPILGCLFPCPIASSNHDVVCNFHLLFMSCSKLHHTNSY